jgi:hypothetical protein
MRRLPSRGTIFAFGKTASCRFVKPVRAAPNALELAGVEAARNPFGTTAARKRADSGYQLRDREGSVCIGRMLV